MATIMERPFPVYFDPTNAQNKLEVVIDFQAPLNDEAKKRIQEVITTFTKLGSVGGLAGVNCNPGQSGLFLHTSQIGQQSLWVFQEVYIDPASLFILLNMIHFIHIEDAPIAMVHILWSEISQIKDLMSIQFPRQWPQLSFPLEIGELLDVIDIEIRFREPQDIETIENVVDTMSIWLLATHRGAYADNSFDPSKTAVFLGPDVMDVSAERIIWYIDIMRCNESALDGFINLLEWIHQKISYISCVEIGP